MSSPDEDTFEQQAYLTRFLLDYTAVPLVGAVFLRGILPTPHAVRIVTGAAGATAPGELTAYEIPLSDEDDEPLTAPLLLGWTRALVSDARPRTDSSVMNIPLTTVDTSALAPNPPTDTDRVLRVLRTLAFPFVETPPDPALCGFRFTGRDRMRLYLATDRTDGLIAADVQLTGALTALLAALPALIGEEERWTTDLTNPVVPTVFSQVRACLRKMEAGFCRPCRPSRGWGAVRGARGCLCLRGSATWIRANRGQVGGGDHEVPVGPVSGG
ncbi:hypothetical protein DVH02_12760 [Streptomyces corynorhini]|uniref:Uncharacterized protein n=1 Tax=Streptomyces corynorhini TaxID=2282652 RepID=A0A370B7J5_9ACTN|nr:hypothetical protein DVH02_12760 [Streptomyces corynorhini]